MTLRRFLVALSLLVVGCGDGEVPPALDQRVPADMSPNGTCPADVTVEHLCNKFGPPGHCFYRDTQLACVNCYPVGCVGTVPASFVFTDGGTQDFICVKSCDDCQPQLPSGSCFTE